MHDVQVQRRFVELRSQGWSFARIADELKVARNTLIEWSRKFQFEIHNLRTVELEALGEQLLASRETRARALAEQLRVIEAELAKRDLATVSTAGLFSLARRLRQEFQQEIGPMRFSSAIKDIPGGDYCEYSQNWIP